MEQADEEPIVRGRRDDGGSYLAGMLAAVTALVLMAIAGFSLIATQSIAAPEAGDAATAHESVAATLNPAKR